MSALPASFRRLRQSPGFAFAAILLATVGIAASTTAFTLVNSLFFKARAGIADPATLHNVHPISTRDGTYGGWSHPDFLSLREQAGHLGELAAFTGIEAGFAHEGRSQLVLLQLVSANYLELLGTKPALGRFFHAAEDRSPGTHPVAVISHRLWQSRFNADPAVLGRSVQLNGIEHTVIGVAERDFHGTFLGFDFDVWIPLAMARVARQEASLTRHDAAWLEFVLRTPRPAAVQEELHRLAQRIAEGRAAEQREFRVQLHPNRPLDDSLRGAALGFAAVLSGLALLLLVTACLNLGSLLVARAEERRRESAVRLALGCSRGRLVRDWLLDCGLIFSLGGGLGLALAHAMARADLFRQPSAALGLEFEFAPDWRAFVFSLATTLVAAVATGLLPAVRAARTDLVTDLKGGGQAHASTRLRHGFVCAQIACAIVPLVIAGMFARTVDRQTRVHPGFEAAGLQSIEMNLSLLPDETGRRGRETAQQLLEAARQVPGVVSATIASRMPLSIAKQRRALVPKNPTGTPPGSNQPTWITTVEEDYFATLGVALSAGRGFTAEDSRSGAAPVIILSETTARLWFGDGLALNREITGGNTTYRVVGIVQDVKYDTLWEKPAPQVYLPLGEALRSRHQLIVRTSAPVAATGPLLSGALQRAAGDLPLSPALSVADHIDFSLLQQKLGAKIAAVLGAVSLLLAAVGLYSTLALSAAQQTREYGLRLCLGATPRDLILLVARRAGLLVLAGSVAGGASAVATSASLRGLLHGVGSVDGVVYLVTFGSLLLVALLAAWLPARRAARVNPLDALRAE